MDNPQMDNITFTEFSDYFLLHGQVWLALTIFNYIEIKLDKGITWIEPRQSYCDRGRFSVKVDSRCPKTFCVDHQDMFPRYYFGFKNMISELESWFAMRKVNILKIELKGLPEEKSKDEEVENAGNIHN